jgi:hypothetical protein
MNVCVCQCTNPGFPHEELRLLPRVEREIVLLDMDAQCVVEVDDVLQDVASGSTTSDRDLVDCDDESHGATDELPRQRIG